MRGGTSARAPAHPPVHGGYRACAGSDGMRGGALAGGLAGLWMPREGSFTHSRGYCACT